jgi:serine/threonine protein kinase
MLQVKQYELRRIIGQGAFGIVNLGVDINTGTKYVSLLACLYYFLFSSNLRWRQGHKLGTAHNHVSDTVSHYTLFVLQWIQAVKEFSKAKLRKKDRQNLFRLGPRGRGLGRRGPTIPAEEERSPLDLIRGEIAILKKLNHTNIVKLYEVLDVAAEDSMYMGKYCRHGVVF